MNTTLQICAIAVTVSMVALVVLLVRLMAQLGGTLRNIDKTMLQVDSLVVASSSTLLEVRRVISSAEAVVHRADDIAGGVHRLSRRAVVLSDNLLDRVEGVASKADYLVRGAMVAVQVVKERLGKTGKRIFESSRSSSGSIRKEDNGHVRQSR